MPSSMALSRASGSFANRIASSIVVDDDGPGIPVEEQEKVFAPFYRLDASRDPGKAGVGLGLSVARTIAREHGGDVTLTNRDDGGLSARVELPKEAMPKSSVRSRQPVILNPLALKGYPRSQHGRCDRRRPAPLRLER